MDNSYFRTQCSTLANSTQLGYEGYPNPPNIAPESSGYTTFCYDNGESMQGIMLKELDLKEGYYTIGQYAFKADQANFLGQGGFGKVYKGINRLKENQHVAIKVMLLKNQKILQMCRKQILRQQLVQSEGIVKIYKSKILPLPDNEKCFVIACELMEKGQLQIPKTGIPHEEALKLLKDILLSYGALYRRKMAHRDLKPQNILMNKANRLKISDFGSAVEQTDRNEVNSCTKEYASPQQCKNQDHTDKCDVYSIACILFQMLVGQPPQRASCLNQRGYNQVDFQKIKAKLKQRGIPQLTIQFLEGCFRLKEVVEKQLEGGKRIEDPTLSRFSWQDVYVHKLFDGSLIHIPRDVVGNSILLTMKTYAICNSVDLIKLLRSYWQMKNKIQKNDLISLLRQHNMSMPKEDIDRLDKVYGGRGWFDLGQLLKALDSVNQQQYSQYSAVKSRAFFELFNPKDPFILELKSGMYSKRTQLSIEDSNLTSFPILPEMKNLRKIQIKTCPIQVLEVRLNTPNLQHLTIAECQIERIITIRGCPGLATLYLNNNKLVEIEGLQMLLNLKQIHFGYNRLKKISNIGHLKKLREAYLYVNRISAIQGLVGCTSLSVLWLANNRIKELGTDILQMKEAPLSEIRVYQNKVRGTQMNRLIFDKFKEQHPSSHLYVSGFYAMPNEQFELSYQSIVLKEGKYRFVCHNRPSKCISIGKNKKGWETMQLVEKHQKDADQLWYIKKLEEDDDFSIFTPNKGKIIEMKNEGECTPITYQECDQLEEDVHCRWVFQKRQSKQTAKAVYSIKLANSNFLIRYADDHNEVKAYRDEYYKDLKKKGQMSQDCDLWHVEFVQPYVEPPKDQ